MKLSSRKLSRSRAVELNMTTMIDVIFLLLIFFMVNSSFHLTEKNLDSSIQTQNKSASKPKANLEPAIVDIVKAASGDDFVYKLGTRELKTIEELTNILRQFPNKADGAFVRVSDDAPFGMAAGAIQACYDAEFTTVSYVPKTG